MLLSLSSESRISGPLQFSSPDSELDQFLFKCFRTQRYHLAALVQYALHTGGRLYWPKGYFSFQWPLILMVRIKKGKHSMGNSEGMWALGWWDWHQAQSMIYTLVHPNSEFKSKELIIFQWHMEADLNVLLCSIVMI